MGKIKRKCKAGSRLVVELADTQERVVITVKHVRDKTCDVLLESSGSGKFRIYPLSANDELAVGGAE